MVLRVVCSQFFENLECMLLVHLGPCGSSDWCASMSPFAWTQLVNGPRLVRLSLALSITMTCPFDLWISLILVDRSSRILAHGFGFSTLWFLLRHHIHCLQYYVDGPLISINSRGTL